METEFQDVGAATSWNTHFKNTAYKYKKLLFLVPLHSLDPAPCSHLYLQNSSVNFIYLFLNSVSGANLHWQK